MPRFVPIIIQVKGGEDANRVARQVVNAFKEIEKSADSTAKSTEKSSKQTSNAFKQIEQEADKSAKGASSSFSKYLSSEFFGGLARQAFNAFFSYGKQFVSDAVRLAQDMQNALLGVSTIAAFKGIDQQSAQDAVQNLRLVKAGIITVSDAAVGLKNLLQAGFGLDQSITLLERFSDTAAFGKQAALTYGDAIRSATEGIKNQNSILVDNAGITKNISVILKERGFAMEDLSDKVKGLSAREALYKGLLAESAAQLGDAEKLVGTYTGAVAAEDMAYQNLERSIGNQIIRNQEWVEATKITTEFLNGTTDAIKDEHSETAKFVNNLIHYAAVIKATAPSVATGLFYTYKAALQSLAGLNDGFSALVLKSTELLVDSIKESGALMVNTISNAINKVLGIARLIPAALSPEAALLGAIPDIPLIQTQRTDFGSKQLFEQMRKDFSAAQESVDRSAAAHDDYERILDRLSNAAVARDQKKTLTDAQNDRTRAAASNEFASDVKAAGKAAKDTFKLSGTLPVPTSGNPAIDNKLREVAARYGLDERLAFAQIFQESRFNPRAVSPKGARGLGQFMPGTGAQYGLRGRADFANVDKSLEAYGHHMSDLLARYGGNVDLALIAYNWGPDNADKVLASYTKGGKGVRLPAETRGYLADIKKFGPFGKSAATHQEIGALMTLEMVRRNAAGPLETPGGVPGTDVGRRLTLDEQYRQSLLEQLDYQKQLEAVTLRRRSLDLEYFQDSQRMTVELGNLDSDLAKIRIQNADDQFTEQRRLLTARTEEKDLLTQIQSLKDQIANGPYNESLRIELALLEDINGIRRRDEEAIKAQNRAQLELADATIVHGQQVRAAVMEHLASQRTMTEAWSDGIIAAYDKVVGFLDRGIEKLTHGIPIVTQLVSALVHQLANRVFQRFLDVLFPQSGGGQQQGPGFANVLFGGGGFGNGRNAVTGGFAGGSGAAQYLQNSLGQTLQRQFFSGMNLGGGGITAPTATLSAAVNGGLASSVLHEAGHTGAATATGALGSGSLKASFGAMLPLLGLSLGATAGGQSRFGTILGGAGGLLAGGIGAAFLTPGLFAASGIFGSMGPAIVGLLTNPITAVAAGALIVGALLLKRNAERRKNETDRATLNNDTYSQVIQVLNDARAGRYDSPGAAIAAFDQIKSSYFQRIAGYDSKTKRIATDVWNDTKNGFEYYRPMISKAANDAITSRELGKNMIPEFAHGGMVPHRAAELTAIKVRPGEVMIPPGGFGVTVPGVDRGYDSVYTMARPGTKVLTRSQAAGARGFLSGGTLGNEGGDIVFDVLDDRTAALLDVVLAGLKSSDGRKIIVRTIASDRADRVR